MEWKVYKTARKGEFDFLATQSLQLYKFKLACYYADSKLPQSQSKTRLNLEARLYDKKTEI